MTQPWAQGHLLSSYPPPPRSSPSPGQDGRRPIRGRCPRAGVGRARGVQSGRRCRCRPTSGGSRGDGGARVRPPLARVLRPTSTLEPGGPSLHRPRWPPCWVRPSPSATRPRSSSPWASATPITSWCTRPACSSARSSPNIRVPVGLLRVTKPCGYNGRDIPGHLAPHGLAGSASSCVRNRGRRQPDSSLHIRPTPSRRAWNGGFPSSSGATPADSRRSVTTTPSTASPADGRSGSRAIGLGALSMRPCSPRGADRSAIRLHLTL